MDDNAKLEADRAELERFEQYRTTFTAKARERQFARTDRGDDTPYYNCVLEEMLFALFRRVEALEEILTPASTDETAA